MAGLCPHMNKLISFSHTDRWKLLSAVVLSKTNKPSRPFLDMEQDRWYLQFFLPRIIAVIKSKSLLKPLFLMSVIIKSVIAMHNLID